MGGYRQMRERGGEIKARGVDTHLFGRVFILPDS